MSISELANIGEFISGFAVVVSLIYLALQTRQNAKHTMALIHQGRANQATERMGQIAGDPTLANIMTRAAAGDVTLQDTEIARYIVFTMATLTNFEDQFFQYREGLLTESDFEYTSLAVKHIVLNPGFRSTWQLLKSRYAKPFQDFIDKLIVASPPMELPGLPALWRTLAARELGKVVTAPAAPAPTQR